MVPPAGVSHTIGHHYVAQRVVQVAVKQAALVFWRRHIVLSQRGIRGRPKARPHTAALFFDNALVHGLAELTRLGSSSWVTI